MPDIDTSVELDSEPVRVKVPALIVVVPVYVLAPVNVNDAPLSVNATVPPVPLLFLITPAKVVVPPVTVNVDVVATYEFRITSPTALPVNEANDCELPYKSKVAFVPPIDKADEEDKDPPLPNFNVPLVIVVVPVYVLAPVNVNDAP